MAAATTTSHAFRELSSGGGGGDGARPLGSSVVCGGFGVRPRTHRARTHADDDAHPEKRYIEISSRARARPSRDHHYYYYCCCNYIIYTTRRLRLGSITVHARAYARRRRGQVTHVRVFVGLINFFLFGQQ